MEVSVASMFCLVAQELHVKSLHPLILLISTPREPQKKALPFLKRFLEYAKTGELPETYVSHGEADSPFEEDVADAIRSLGYEIDHQVGTAGFKIDLGVRSPSNPHHHILAVECDGATYHSALWARERDHMRQQVLEGFGWHFHRIWSTDWFYHRDKEIQRLRKALDEAQRRDLSRSLEGSNKEIALNENNPIHIEGLQDFQLEESSINAKLYKKANVIVSNDFEPHERPVPEVIHILTEIINVEGPIHIDEIAKRYATFHGKSRVGSRIHDYVTTALSKAHKEHSLENKGKFWATPDQSVNPPIRDRSQESQPTTNAENISPMEIIACSNLIEEESGKVDEDELVRNIAKVLGFKRAGPEFQSHVKTALKKRMS